MSDLSVTRHLDGCPAIFLRFAGPDHVVIEVSREERIVSREFWKNLPIQDADLAGKPMLRLTG
jgi:hypothetical protein